MGGRKLRFCNHFIRKVDKSSSADDAKIRELLLGVWGLEPGFDIDRFRSYRTIYEDIKPNIDEITNFEVERGEIVAFLNLIRDNQDKTMEEINSILSLKSWQWLPTSPEDRFEMLGYILRMWLFIEPDFSDKSLCLHDIVSQSLLAKNTPARKDRDYWLSEDFSAKSLTRKAGLRLIYTSSLEKHLTLTGKSNLLIFRHISALNRYIVSKEGSLYPKDFLIETNRTFELLFQPANNAASKRVARIGKTKCVDIEAALNNTIDAQSRRDLSTYTYWGERLLEIQRAYDRAGPKNLRQWWYDRRNRFEWATFWTAAIIFALTVVFGIISSVTGIMQVWASFQAL